MRREKEGVRVAQVVLELGLDVFGEELVMLTGYGKHTRMVEGTFQVLVK